MKPAGTQPPAKKAEKFALSGAPTKLRKYGHSSFSGRPLQTSTKPAPVTGTSITKQR